MASIQRRETKEGKVSYRVQVRLKGFPVQRATFERKTDAKKWATQTEAAIREGRHFKTTEAKRHTLADMVDRYIQEVLPSKPKSSYNYTIFLNWWKNELGDRVLADITPPLISEYRDKLASGVTQYGKPRGPATVNRYLGALSTAFTTATNEWQWLDDSPMRKVAKQKEPRGRVRYLDEEERSRLLKACRVSWTPFLLPVVLVALSSGCRKTEIMNLRWGDVDIEKGRITLLETKNGEIRVVPLVGPAQEEMKRLSKVRRIDSDFCFPRTDGKKPLDIRKAWEAAIKLAEVENFHFHDLRHSCASYLAMSGASLAEIAEVLGHKTLSMVRRYAHLSEAHTAGVVERMNQKIFG
ncbi:MAG: site-specific integrase [Magnetococcales bacterium]|nr:site-specific integrase [Magnetococcales bacterium]